MARLRHLLLLPVLTVSLSACAGADALMNHGDLDVHTHMSETVFLDPVGPELKTVYISVRNTSDYQQIDLRGALAYKLQARGYTVVSDPRAAHYMLQANILQAGKLPNADQGGLLSAGFGQPLLAGAVAGGLTGGLTNSWGAGAGVGLAAGLGTMAFNAMYQDVTYAITTDIQISEKPLHGEVVRQTRRSHAGHGNHAHQMAITEATPYSAGYTESDSVNGGSQDQEVSGRGEFMQYQVRDVAYADKVNLNLDQATPALVDRLSSSLANLFS